MDYIPSDVLGSIIKFVTLNDIFNLAKTSKLLYKSVLSHYKFNNYKILLRLSDSDFNTILRNVNINSKVIFKTIIRGNKHQLLKNYLNKIDPNINNNWAIRHSSEYGYYKLV